ncbi:RnfABCDGE type electron transport complex subunit D [Candidatus Woesearchaeota archaeon]|nr:RnfABCDGE type electron transport complex subunit D [Candidatus Woesearchaeota archaeon]
MQKSFELKLLGEYFSNYIDRRLWLVVIALLPASFASVFVLGNKALVIQIIAVLLGMLTQSLINILLSVPSYKSIGAAIAASLLSAMLLPVNAPLWLPILSSIVAVALINIFGSNIPFHPSIVSIVFLIISFPLLFNQVTFGTISPFALIIGGLILMIARVIDWRIPLFFLISVYGLIFVLQQNVFQLLNTDLLLAAFFLLPTFNTFPRHIEGKATYAIGAGMLTVLIRSFNPLHAVLYAILFMSFLTPLIERWQKTKTQESS